MTWLPEIFILLVLPAWLIYGLIRVLFWRKRKNGIIVEITRLGFITYFILLFYVVWISPTGIWSYLPVNLIPIHTINQYFTEVSSGVLSVSVAFTNIVGNIVLTFPIGVLIYLLYKKVRFVIYY
ncbi:MAG: hypothetical protein ACI4XL_07150 [Bacillus sp. (in: firmicutes)]